MYRRSLVPPITMFVLCVACLLFAFRVAHLEHRQDKMEKHIGVRWDAHLDDYVMVAKEKP